MGQNHDLITELADGDDDENGDQPSPETQQKRPGSALSNDGSQMPKRTKLQVENEQLSAIIKSEDHSEQDPISDL